jgi:hypothetical protein
MHFGRSLEYQFVASSSREIRSDSVMVASSSSAEVMAALQHIMYLQGSILPWYFGGGAARYCGGQGASCR